MPEQIPKVKPPRIINPVSRVLPVADPQRSVGFYRDVVGFVVTPRPVADTRGPIAAELVLGPARIQLSGASESADSTGAMRPRGAAMVFFETDDLGSFRRAILARGGSPTEPEKVSWIKMEVFQVRDPDGHMLWFGQTYHQPDSPPDPSRQVQELLPEFTVTDIPAAIAYYENQLGFHINYARDDLGIMSRDGVTLILSPKGEGRREARSCYAYIHDADRFHAELVARGARLQGEPVSHPWGLRDFQVLDLEDNRITFGQPFE